jgi:hypothetical protein
MSLVNSDVELAKSTLIEKNLSLVVVKKGQVIFETKKSGISGFLQVIEKLDKNLAASAVADKIVGVAAATLCVYSSVSSVFAQTISDEGIRVLKENNITCLFEKKVPNILNRNKNDVCPFEKLAISSSNTEDAYLKLKSLAHKIMRKSTVTNC